MLAVQRLGLRSKAVGEKPAVHPRSTRCPHKCSNLCASHTPSYRRPLPAHVSRIAVNSIPHQLLRCPLTVLGLTLSHSFRACHLFEPTRPHVPSALGYPADRGAVFASRSARRINTPKGTYVVLLRGTLHATLKPPATATFPEAAPQQYRDYFLIVRVQRVLKLVMGSQQPSPKITSRSNTQLQHAQTQTSDAPQARRRTQIFADLTQHVC